MPITLKKAALLIIVITFVGCEDNGGAPAASEAATQSPDAQVLASQLVEVKETRIPTAVLSEYPEMNRDLAYEIQSNGLRSESVDKDYLVGWKMGGTRVVDTSVPPDPSFAYILRSDSIDNGATLDASRYVAGDLLVEAEIAFIMGQDLKDGEHSLEAVAAAVAEVAGAIELIDIRIIPGDDGIAPPINHMIAANLSHAGLILTSQRVALGDINLVDETAVVHVDGVEKASGAGNQIMGTTPMDALHWIANALPAQGRYLRAGDVVITGSLYDNPTIVAGNEAVVEFSSLGSISVSLGEK